MAILLSLAWPAGRPAVEFLKPAIEPQTCMITFHFWDFYIHFWQKMDFFAIIIWLKSQISTWVKFLWQEEGTPLIAVMMLILLISLISQGRQQRAEKLCQSTASTSTFRYICNLHPYFHTSRCYLSRNIYVTIRVDMHPCVEWECVMCMDVFPSSVKKLGPFHPPSSVNLSIKMYKQPLHSQLSAVCCQDLLPPSPILSSGYTRALIFYLCSPNPDPPIFSWKSLRDH